MSATKLRTSGNMEMVSLDGATPCDKLLESGEFKQGRLESFDNKRKLDSKN
jgi:hypothetical protein